MLLESIDEFGSRTEMYAYLHKNKANIIRQKRMEVKHTDGLIIAPTLETLKPKLLDDGVSKSLILYKADQVAASKLLDKEQLNVRAIINTTNVLDSHGDVHIDGLWNRSIKNNSSSLLMLQEHKMEFSKIIASDEDLRASVRNYTWAELGYNFTGSTQALQFDAVVKFSRNPEMFYNYAMGYVKNHSVGMQYLKIELAFSDDRYEEEYAVWQKYRPIIANGADADARGYFYAVLEAKVFEGSAVPIGSNTFTPTTRVKSSDSDNTTQDIENIKEVFKHFKF